MVQETTARIFSELNTEEKKNWFDLKQKKFLHQIDTFYYSVKLKNDFTKESSDPACLALRRYFADKIDRTSFTDDYETFFCKGMDAPLNIRPKVFEYFYDIDLECPQLFDIFIANRVPVSEDGVTSVTPEIIVQLRSELLWQYGVTKAFEYSFHYVEVFCSHFNLTINEVKENRADYCWHSNYLQNPEKFFRVDKFMKMQVSRFRHFNFHVTPKPGDDEYENDYIGIGKRGDKCFVRIYLKSKEVIQKGYKSWFLKEWFLNGLINRYDFYVYEKCYLLQNWNYLNKARLEWYLEYGRNERIKKDIRAILDGVTKPSEESILKLADSLTPRVTLITNVEFQTSRKMSKSFIMDPRYDNSEKGVCRRVYDYMDSHAIIAEYLTDSVLRLVDRGTDSNKGRCEYCAFWKCLRSTRLIDCKKPPKELKLIREYNRNLNSQVVKKRALSATISYSLYTKGIENTATGFADAADLLCVLNDNDIEYMKRVKNKRRLQLNSLLNSEPLDDLPEHTFCIVSNETGEIL